MAEILGKNIGTLTVDVKLSVDYDTMNACLRLVELYLNNNDYEELNINCSEPGNWDLSVNNRIGE